MAKSTTFDDIPVTVYSFVPQPTTNVSYCFCTTNMEERIGADKYSSAGQHGNKLIMTQSTANGTRRGGKMRCEWSCVWKVAISSIGG